MSVPSAAAHLTASPSSSPHPQTAEDLAQQNIETIVRLEKATRAHRTLADRLVDAISAFCGSLVFVWVHLGWFGLWMGANLLWGGAFDPYPFPLLMLIVSLEAIFLSTFILISQNRDAHLSEQRSQLDLQINLLAEQETTTMLTMLKQIAEPFARASREALQ